MDSPRGKMRECRPRARRPQHQPRRASGPALRVSVDPTPGHDYGYDLTMSTYGDTGEFEPGHVYLQVKATDRLPRLADGGTISWLVKSPRPQTLWWLAETYPVILVVYDGQKDRAYWMHIQRYVSGARTPELFTAGETMTVHIPMASRFNPWATRSIARDKNILLARLGREGHDHV